MTNYAPVFIPTLNRFNHFKRCVETLSACTFADRTDLYIALDYPLKDSHCDGYKKIENYIENIGGFKNIIIIKREYNFGAEKNFFNTITEIFEKHDQLIFSEDDNVFAPTFLKIINNGLDTYKNRSDIFSVSGYNNPYPMPTWYKYDVYLRNHAFTAWGVGIWREKWNKVDWSLENFNEMLSRKENFKILKKYYQRHLPGILEIRNTGVILADVFLLVYLINNNMSSVYPVKTRVQNTGHDGSGLHGGYSKRYLNQNKYDGPEDIYFPPDLKPDKKLNDLILKKQVQLPFIHRIIRLFPTPIKNTVRWIFRK